MDFPPDNCWKYTTVNILIDQFINQIYFCFTALTCETLTSKLLQKSDIEAIVDDTSIILEYV